MMWYRFLKIEEKRYHCAMDNTRYIIRWWIYMLLLQWIIGWVWFLMLYKNYDNITKSESIRERYTPTIKLQNRHTAAPINNSTNSSWVNNWWTWDNIYSGIIGNITIGEKDIWSPYERKFISYRDISINPFIHDALRIFLQQPSSFTRDQQTIIYTLQQAKRDNIVQTLNDLNFLSKYTSNTTITNPITNPREQLDQAMKNADQSYIISYLQSLESAFINLLNTKDKKLWRDNAFFKSDKFAYVYNQLYVDTPNKYKKYINSAANIFNLNPNLITACIFVEQLRAFYTFKWLFKSIAQTNTYLTVMSKQSFGIGGMKLQTAEQLEQRLATNKPEIYKTYFSYEDPKNISQQRLARLTDSQDYYYQILYTAWILYRYSTERDRAGYTISNNPWVMATMYNIWYSEPHSNPDIWWSFMKIESEKYSFWWLAMLIYYYLEIYG